MKTHIPFHSLSSSPSDHEAPEGDCALLLNLIAEDGTLHPFIPNQDKMAEIPVGSRLVATHRTGGHVHLIIETAQADGSYDYHWQEARRDGETATVGASTPLPIATGIHHVNSFASLGDTLCMALDNDTLLAQWKEQENHYVTIGHADLLYDITVTQDQQTRLRATLPITAALANHLDHPSTVLTTNPTLPSHVFAGWNATGDHYATGATMVAAQMEATLDQQLLQMGPGAMKHVCLGIAALRTTSGHHVMCSNLFALLPADIPTIIHADREHDMLAMEAWSHRHTITVTMRNNKAMDSGLIEGVDIFLTRPLLFLDVRQATDIVTDGGGHTTQLTFSHLDKRDTLQALDNAQFHHSMTIRPEEMGVPLMIQNIATDSQPIDLASLHRIAMGAQCLLAHNNRLTRAVTTPVLHSPLEIGLHYRYHTLDSDERQAMEADDLPNALAEEQMVGDRPDLYDHANGTTATLVVHGITNNDADDIWWETEVQYPLPGAIMYPGSQVKALEYHIRVVENGDYRYYTTRQALEPLVTKGMSVAVFTTTGNAHRTQRAPFLSLLLQQARVLSYDTAHHIYEENYALWDEEDVSDFVAHQAKAQNAWTLASENSMLHTSVAGMPLLMSKESTTSVGHGAIFSIFSNTRRTADGLYGDGQFYAFTDSGVWLLRFSKGQWSAQQSVTRARMRQTWQAVATSDAVVFISPRGVMMLKGSTCSCISDTLRGKPFNIAHLPHGTEIMGTEPLLSAAPTSLPEWNGCFWDKAKMAYDAVNDRLWFFTDEIDTTMLVYSIRSNSWAMAAMPHSQLFYDGIDLWQTDIATDVCHISKWNDIRRGLHPIALVTRPLTLGHKHVAKTVKRMIVRGLFCHRGKNDSHIGVALYGSNDLHHWQLVGSSEHQYMHHRRGTPFKWFRLLAIGSIRHGESLEGVSMET